MQKKRIVAIISICLVLAVLFSSMVSATSHTKGPFDKIFELISDLWGIVLKFGTFSFLLGDDITNNVVPLTRLIFSLIIGIVLYSVLSLIPGGFLSKPMRIALAGLFTILGFVFIPPAILLALGASYGTIFAFILLGAFVGGGLWILLFATPTPNRAVIILKLFILYVIFMLVGMFDQAAKATVSAPGTVIISGFAGASGLGDFTEWGQRLALWAYLTIFLAGAYLFWQLFTGGEESRYRGEEVAPEAAAGVGRWFKKEGMRWTPEYKKARAQEAARSFNSALSEVAIERKFHKLVEDVERGVKEVKVEYDELIGGRTSIPDAKDKFEHLAGKLKAETIEDLEKVKKEWLRSGIVRRGVRRTTFDHQRDLKNLLDKLQKDPEFVAKHRVKLTELRTWENQILKNHDKTASNLEELSKLIDELQQKVQGALTVGSAGVTASPYGGAGAFNQHLARGKLHEFSPAQMDRAVALAEECEKLQSDKGTGVIRLLTAIMEDIRKLTE